MRRWGGGGLGHGEVGGRRGGGRSEGRGSNRRLASGGRAPAHSTVKRPLPARRPAPAYEYRKEGQRARYVRERGAPAVAPTRTEEEPSVDGSRTKKRGHSHFFFTLRAGNLSSKGLFAVRCGMLNAHFEHLGSSFKKTHALWDPDAAADDQRPLMGGQLRPRRECCSELAGRGGGRAH